MSATRGISRFSTVVALAAVVAIVAACPGDKRDRGADTTAAIPVDTTPTDLSQVQTSLPAAVPDTFTPAPRRTARRSGGAVAEDAGIPPAPPALLDAVERERSFSRFCYQEFGQKVDPTLTGGVAVVVTVGSNGVTNARVANDSWTSGAGTNVNRCLNDRAATAWKLGPGVVSPGRYLVRMTFRGA